MCFFWNLEVGGYSFFIGFIFISLVLLTLGWSFLIVLKNRNVYNVKLKKYASYNSYLPIHCFTEKIQGFFASWIRIPRFYMWIEFLFNLFNITKYVLIIKLSKYIYIFKKIIFWIFRLWRRKQPRCWEKWRTSDSTILNLTAQFNIWQHIFGIFQHNFTSDSTIISDKLSCLVVPKRLALSNYSNFLIL